MKPNRNRRIFSSARIAESGFTLIEVLIAILVLAFGLLGFALLQTMNVRFTKSAQERTVATNLAYEIVELMRMQRALGSYYNTITVASFAGVVPPAGGCVRASAAPPTVNIARWKCEVRSALPEGAANVVLAANGTVDVTVQWGDESWRVASEKTNRSVTIRSRL